MPKKTYNEKLNSPGGLPKIEDISGNLKSVAMYGGDKLLVAAPLQYNEIMAKIPEGKVITADKIRAYLAEKAGADGTCKLTAGIFINTCAHAGAERGDDKFPYWRTLKMKGELNEKYPGGIDGHKTLLESEGHIIVQKGSRYYVQNYESVLVDLNRI